LLHRKALLQCIRKLHWEFLVPQWVWVQLTAALLPGRCIRHQVCQTPLLLQLLSSPAAQHANRTPWLL
jgi:hypothetical protein